MQRSGWCCTSGHSNSLGPLAWRWSGPWKTSKNVCTCLSTAPCYSFIKIWWAHRLSWHGGGKLIPPRPKICIPTWTAHSLRNISTVAWSMCRPLRFCRTPAQKGAELYILHRKTMFAACFAIWKIGRWFQLWTDHFCCDGTFLIGEFQVSDSRVQPVDGRLAVVTRRQNITALQAFVAVDEIVRHGNQNNTVHFGSQIQCRSDGHSS